VNWGWLKPLLEVLLDWLEKRASKTSEMTDANTPKTIRARWSAHLRERLRSAPPDEGGNR
jgi:hypothetical protein